MISAWAAGVDLASLRGDPKTRYAIERAFMALDAAMRDIPHDLKQRHAIPIGKIAGFRNILAHSYDDILDERVIVTIREDLPQLDATFAAIEEQLGST